MSITWLEINLNSFSLYRLIGFERELGDKYSLQDYLVVRLMAWHENILCLISIFGTDIGIDKELKTSVNTIKLVK
jgi:hypothetical protein